MKFVTGSLRIGLATLVVFVGLVACLFAGLMSDRLFNRLERIWHTALIRSLGVHPVYRGVSLTAGSLVVANHVSWLDILVIGARWHVVFLGKSEIARWPVLGWIIRRAGTLFIERGSGWEQSVHEIGEALDKGRCVGLFPEGRTTDGQTVRRFHARLLQAAIDSGAMVHPLGIRYRDREGRPTARVSYAGDQSLLRGVWLTVTEPGIRAELELFDALAPGNDRQALAREAEKQVRAHVEASPAGL